MSDVVAAAADRPLGPGRTVWLASYPKSGNTWLRAVVTALSTHPHLFGVNHLGSGSQPYSVLGALPRFGLDPRWLNDHEIDTLRHALITAGIDDDSTQADESGTDRTPILRKTHEVHRPGSPGAEPFPLAATRAAILVVRDPRDVACSYAPFFGISIDQAIDAMGFDRRSERASASTASTSQPWGSWSTHTQSWLADDVPFPVHLVRYEDLRRDTVGTLGPVFEAIGLACTAEQLDAAVEQTRFERLQQSEAQRGFRETSPRTDTFFRSGRAGGWRDELTDDQVATVELHHRTTMEQLGYDPVSPALRITSLPAHLGLAIRLGKVDDVLPGSRRIRPQIWADDDRILVRFGPRRRMLLERGRVMTLHWPILEGDQLDHDLSWVAQGWAVSIATLQRGDLALHASTLRVGGAVVAIAGASGAGKSTTALGLVARGHELLVDDTTLVRLDGDVMRVTPYCRNVHVLPDTAAKLGIEFDSLDLLAGNRIKAALRPAEPPVDPVAIDCIIVLGNDSTLDTPVATEIRGSARIAAVHEHLTRNGLAEVILGRARTFELMSKLATSTRVVQVLRPTEGWSLDAVLDLVEQQARPAQASAASDTAAAESPPATS
ncbi:MAG: hypothetical protein RI958_2022 [Actinomycetota bacterium]